MNVYESIMQGLNEAVEYENGNRKARTVKISVAPLPDIHGQEVRRIRMSFDMTQVIFAQVMGVSVKTIEAWEGGRSEPNGTARRLLSMMRADPKFMEKYNLLV